MNIIHCLTDGIKSRVTKHTRKTKHKAIADYAFPMHANIQATGHVTWL